MGDPLVKVNVQGVWTGGTKTSVHTRNYPPFSIDEPQAMGGEGSAPDPLEYLLGSLCGCEGVILGMVAKEMNFKFDGLEMAVEGRLNPKGLMGDPNVSPYFHVIKQTVTVKTQASAETLDQVKEKVEARCPVFNILKDAGIEIQAEWKAI